MNFDLISKNNFLDESDIEIVSMDFPHPQKQNSINKPSNGFLKKVLNSVSDNDMKFHNYKYHAKCVNRKEYDVSANLRNNFYLLAFLNGMEWKNANTIGALLQSW